MKFDYTRSLILTNKDYPETPALVATREMLRLQGAKVIEIKTYESGVIREFRPSYIADFSVMHPIDAIENLIHASPDLVHDIFKAHSSWPDFTPHYRNEGGFSVKYQDWLLAKMREAGMSNASTGGNDWEYDYFFIKETNKRIRIFSLHLRGPDG